MSTDALVRINAKTYEPTAARRRRAFSSAWA